MTVVKGNKKASYIVSFSLLDEPLKALFEPIYEDEHTLNGIFSVNFFDVEAIYSGAQDYRFDAYSDMNYSRAELEYFFVRGIGKAILDFCASHKNKVKVIIYFPMKPILAQYYERLLKKHSDGVKYIYRKDLADEESLYVIEIL